MAPSQYIVPVYGTIIHQTTAKSIILAHLIYHPMSSNGRLDMVPRFQSRVGALLTDPKLDDPKLDDPKLDPQSKDACKVEEILRREAGKVAWARYA